MQEKSSSDIGLDLLVNQNKMSYNIKEADIIKIAMIDIANTLIKEGLKSKMILQIHDELIFEMHPSEELKLKSIVESCMIKASTLDVPIVVDMGIGNNWLEAH